MVRPLSGDYLKLKLQNQWSIYLGDMAFVPGKGWPMDVEDFEFIDKYKHFPHLTKMAAGALILISHYTFHFLS